MDVVPASADDKTADVVQATLFSFIEHEERESLAVVEKLCEKISKDGLAVAGAAGSLDALRQGNVDVLVLARDFPSERALACLDCGAVVFDEAPGCCLQCDGARRVWVGIKEELVRLAEQAGCRVEVVNQSDELMRLGGVGCLLRFAPRPNEGRRAA